LIWQAKKIKEENMPKTFNLAALNRKMEKISKEEAKKLIGAYDTCDEACDDFTPPGDPGSGQIYYNGGVVFVKPPVD
jgi:hypothetical protein